jgi:putative ABC transport system permease protein
VLFGTATVVALPDDLATLAVPGPTLLVVLIGAGVIGVIAAALPARRAARLDVLDAVSAA